MTSIVFLGLLALSGVTISEVRAGVRLRQVPNAPAASPTPSEARAIFYALLDERSVAVENGVYSRIEPLYAHIEELMVFRPDLALHGWKEVEAFWQRSLSRPRSDFHVYWNDDLVVTVEGDLIVGGVTWSNQSGQNPRRYGCLSLTLRREENRWVIVQEHSSNWSPPRGVPSIYSSARTELAKLLIYGLFRKIRVLAQDGVGRSP